jgi:hypothetical protein
LGFSETESTTGTSNSNTSELSLLFNNILAAFELIVKDTKYLDKISDGSTLIHNVLSMLDNVNDYDLRIISIRVLAILSNNIHNKVLSLLF